MRLGPAIALKRLAASGASLRSRSSAAFLGIAGFFTLKVLSGLAIITASANWLRVDGFADFTQFSLFLAYLVLISSGGVVNGVVRQVSAANDDCSRQREVVHAAASIWALASLVSFSATVALAGPLSTVLTGSTDHAGLVIALAAFSMLAGLGQILCGALTGMGRAPTSILFQAIGLSVGVGASLLGLFRQDVAVATLGLAAGPILTTLLGLFAVPRTFYARSARSAVWREAGVQIRFAAAFLVTATIPPLILFGLRFVYRDTFGVAPIAYWLLANRISDINTQIVGLYLSQIFLPTLTATAPERQAGVISRALLLCLGLSLLALAGFLVVGKPVLGLVVQDQLAGSWGYIAGYLFGDAVRSVVSVAMICALARNRPYLYVLMEVIAYGLFALGFVSLTAAGLTSAPYVAYPAAYAVAAVIAWWLLIPDMRPTGFSLGSPRLGPPPAGRE